MFLHHKPLIQPIIISPVGHRAALPTQTIVTPAEDTTYKAVFDTLQTSDFSLRNPDNPSNVTNADLTIPIIMAPGTSYRILARFISNRLDVSNFDLSPRTESSNYSFRFTGFISVPKLMASTRSLLHRTKAAGFISAIRWW